MTCLSCKDSGYIPFLKGDGTISQFARVVCPDCGGFDHERSYAAANMPDRHPEDFDFPCSYTWRSFYEEQTTGRPLESIKDDTIFNSPKDVKVVIRHIDVSQQRSIPHKEKKTGFTGGV